MKKPQKFIQVRTIAALKLLAKEDFKFVKVAGYKGDTEEELRFRAGSGSMILYLIGYNDIEVIYTELTLRGQTEEEFKTFQEKLKASENTFELLPRLTQEHQDKAISEIGDTEAFVPVQLISFRKA